MKIVLFARTLGSTQLCKISQESGLLSNFGSLPKIRNARIGRCRLLGVNYRTSDGMEEAVAHSTRFFCTCMVEASGNYYHLSLSPSYPRL